MVRVPAVLMRRSMPRWEDVEYNTYRSHGALGGLTPTETRAAWITEHQPALS